MLLFIVKQTVRVCVSGEMKELSRKRRAAVLMFFHKGAHLACRMENGFPLSLSLHTRDRLSLTGQVTVRFLVHHGSSEVSYKSIT